VWLWTKDGLVVIERCLKLSDGRTFSFWGVGWVGLLMSSCESMGAGTLNNSAGLVGRLRLVDRMIKSLHE
jgi:hypothetical protein